MSEQPGSPTDAPPNLIFTYNVPVCTCYHVIIAETRHRVAEAYDATYVPPTFIIDQQGYIRYKHVDPMSGRGKILSDELHIVVPEFPSLLMLLPLQGRLC